MEFWLEYGAQRLELRRGVTLIGRSSSCQLVLNDGLVSRQHLRIVTSASEAIAEDLGSVNGAFINDERLEGQRALQTGDRLGVGSQVLTFRTALTQGRAEHRTQILERTQESTASDKLLSSRPQQSARSISFEDSDSATATADLLEVLGSLAEKNLALGRGVEAERILQGHLEGVLRSAAAGEFREIALERAASYAVKLAAATGKTTWLEYPFKLYALYRRPLPRTMADDLYAAMHKAPSVSLTSLRDYLAVLHGVQNELTPAERFVVQRLEGLEHLLAVK